MVMILLNSIEAERDSIWQLHLDSFKSILSYDKAFDHYKYFVWGIIYLADMEILPQKYPKVCNHFLAGKHNVSREKDDSAFNTVATDMALEQSLNRASKTKNTFYPFLFLENILSKGAQRCSPAALTKPNPSKDIFKDFGHNFHLIYFDIFKYVLIAACFFNL